MVMKIHYFIFSNTRSSENIKNILKLSNILDRADNVFNNFKIVHLGI